MINAGTEDIVRVEFIFNAGNAEENIPLLASSANAMLSEGTRTYTSGAINKMLDFHGAFYNLYTDKDTGGLIIFALKKHLKKILELAVEMLFYPIFPASELKALLKKRMRLFLVSREKVENLALDMFFESVFGSDHPYGRQVVADDFSNLEPVMLRDFHKKHYSPQSLAVIISGKPDDKVHNILNLTIGAKGSTATSLNTQAKIPEYQKNIRTHIEKKGALQTAVRIGSATINKRHPDYPGLKITDMLLGGYFGSRLMKNIREGKGFSYGINSLVSSLNLSGFKVISTEVSKKNTQKTIDEILKEIRLLQSIPVDMEELTVVRNYMLGEIVRMFDGPFIIAESFRSVWQYGLDNLYYYRLAEKIRTIEPDEITLLAKTYYNIDDLNIITAG
jgi:predicted Zn-dependent peptidase